MKVHSRQLNETDLQAMQELLLREGRNEWNHITDESIDHQFQLINQEKALAVIAEKTSIVGLAVLILNEACPPRLSKYSVLSDVAYIKGCSCCFKPKRQRFRQSAPEEVY